MVLAVGDVVSSNNGAVTGRIDYQPAAGVEILVTALFGYNSTSHNVGLTDGAASSYPNTTTSVDYAVLSTKIGITNSLYIFVQGNTQVPAFSGIQIK